MAAPPSGCRVLRCRPGQASRASSTRYGERELGPITAILSIGHGVWVAAVRLRRNPVTVAPEHLSPLLRELVLALIDEPVLYDERGRGGALADLIFREIARARRLPLVIPMPHDPRLLRVCNAVLADPASRRTLDEWAGEAGASVRTLARLFDEELSVGFVAWRQRVRFHNALEAIVAGVPIGLVAKRNGYRSASAFSAAFRNVMGQPPSSLREALK
jgi:AraC-like DNA-binding protein